MKLFKRALALLCVAALLAALVGCSEPQAETPSTTTEPEPSAPAAAYGTNDVTARSDYGVTSIQPGDMTMDAVIAVDQNGEPCLTNSEFQIYYWLTFYNFMSSLGAYAAQFGLDYTKPLAAQHSDLLGGEELTIEQYFLQFAVESFCSNYAIEQAAYASGYQLSAEDMAQIEDIADPDGDFAAQAVKQGYESVEDYLHREYGDGMSIAAYQSYVRTLFVAGDYFKQMEEELSASLTDEQVEAYYDENAETFVQENRLQKVNNVSARHILIAPEGSKDTELNDWTEAQWAAAEEKANEVYALWQQNPTEDNFAALAETYSTDGGSNTNGGLYEDFATDRMVTEFTDWCFDAARVPGDTGIIRTSFGYHIMYFVGQTETRTWFETAKQELLSAKESERMDALRAEYPVEFDYAQIVLFDIISTSAAASAPAVG